MASKFGGVPVTGSRFGGVPVTGSRFADTSETSFLGDIGTLLKQGASQAMSTYQVGPQVISGGVEGTEGLIAKNLTAERFQPEAMRQVSEAFKDEAEAMRQAESWYSRQGLQAIGGVVAEIGKQLVTNPRGAAYFTAEQAANMVPAIVGGLSGGAAGSPAGPVGVVGGATVGAFGASAPMEIGAEFIGIVGGELAARNLAPTEENIKTLLADEQFRNTAISQARVKGATVAAVDAATSVIGGRITSGPMRSAIASAAQESLETGAEVAPLVQRNIDALPLSERFAAGAKGYGVDVVGAGVGETAGQVAAYGEADLEEVALEVLGEAGGAIVEVPALGKKFVSASLRSVQPGQAAPAQPGQAAPVQPTPTPVPAPEEVTAEQAITFARTRLSELITKGKGTPDTSAVDPVTGQTRTVPGRPAEVLSDSEIAEMDFLANNVRNPEAVGKAYNLKIKQAAEQRLNEATSASEAVQAAGDMIDMDIEALEREAGIADSVVSTPEPQTRGLVAQAMAPAVEPTLTPAVEPTLTPAVEPTLTPAAEPTLTVDTLAQADISAMPAPERQEFLDDLVAARTANLPEQRQAALTRAAEVYGRTVGPVQQPLPRVTPQEAVARAQNLPQERARTAAPSLEALLAADTRGLDTQDREDFNANLAMARSVEPGPVQTAALQRAAEVYGRAIGPVQPRTAVAAEPSRRTAVPRPTNILGRPASEYTPAQLQDILNNNRVPAITRRGVETELRARTSAPVQETISENFIAIPETVPVVAAQPVAGQSAGQRARETAQRAMDTWAASNGIPSPVTFNAAPAELEAGVAEIADLIGSQWGGRVVAFSDTRPGAINGVAIDNVAYVNVSKTRAAGVQRTALHEFKHTVEQIAKAEAAAGITDTPAQEFVEQIDSVFDDMTDEGKRAYLENFMAAEELASLQGDARETRVQELLQSPELRSEMVADFLGNRATDKQFWQDLAKADPTGFEGFVKRWLAAIDNLLATLRGAKGKARSRLESAKVDTYIRDLNKAKLTAQSALINYRKATAGQVAPAQEAAPAFSRAQSLVETADLAGATNLAKSQEWARGRDFKVALQRRVLDAAMAEGIDPEQDSPQTREYLLEVGLRDAMAALKQNENAIGWYDVKTRQALAVMSLVHPEIARDENARFAFTWALAVTSNGLKVGKNFELAEKAYEAYKRDGRMPNDVGIGTASSKINDSLELFNTLRDEWGIDNLRKFMQTSFTVGEISGISKALKPSGEHAEVTVKGAAILGPKIGNGFFSNLYGDFNSLTMDRWLIRTWGRWTGTLIKAMPEQTAKARDRLQNNVRLILADPAEAKRLGDLIGEKITDDVDALARAVQEASTVPQTRSELNKTEVGQELRKAGNSLAKYLDGQKEAPQNPDERKYIRAVFGDILNDLKQTNAYKDLTMADLQAVLWYAEKRLYETAKEDAQELQTDEDVEGYADDSAPDYANAAASVARKKGITDRRINAALKRVENERSGTARPAAAGSDAQGTVAGAGQQAAAGGFTRQEKRKFIGERAVLRARADRAGDAQQPRAYSGDGGADGRGVRVLKALGVKYTQIWKASRNLGTVFRANDLATPDFFELAPTAENAAKFQQAIAENKAAHPFGAAVYVYPAEDYQQMRLFLTRDGKSGVAVKPDGDIVSVFSTGGAGRAIMELAVSAGGRKLDAFDTILPEFYAPHGFRAVARTRWNDEVARDTMPDWDKNTFRDFNSGEPDVVFMVYDPAKMDAEYSPKDGRVVEEYDRAVAIQKRNTPRFSRAQADVAARIPELERAAQGIKEGTVTREQYEELVTALKPVTPYEEVPAPATEADIRRGLSSDKLDRIGVPSKTLKAGDPVGLRLDIPAYTNHGVWVVSVHEQIPGFAAGKSIGYESVAAVKNPTFGVVESAAVNIAAGKPKATIAVMKGDWKPITPKQAFAAAKLALKSDSWVQVGMDPTRHAYFYDRASMEPVVSADEAIQVGPLVLAKNPVYGNKADFRFSRSQGETPSQQRGINVRNDGDNLYADLIVDGEKTMESRNTNSLRAYVGQTVGIIRTGEGPAKLIGSVKIGEPIEVDEQEFRELEPEHLVPEGSAFDIKPGGTKFLYPLTEARRFDEERAVDSRGIVARDVAFSRAQVDTPEFKRWFGDSKVVDENGEPLVVYHGTRPTDEAEGFDVFDIGAAGAYFTPDPSYAQAFTDDTFDEFDGARGPILPVYLSVQNPLVVRAEDGSPEWEDFVSFGIDRRTILEGGYDGAMLIDAKTGEIDQIIAVRPNQIKSAIGNRGTFDRGSPDIRFSRAQQNLMKLYSALARAADNGPVRAPAAQWKGLLRKQAKPEEITWSGVEDWLDLQEGNVPREAVTEFLSKNGVQVGEVVLGRADVYPDDFLQDTETGRAMSSDDWEREFEESGIDPLEAFGQLVPVGGEPLPGQDATEYGQYTLPGGTNYREVLITLPAEPIDEKRLEAFRQKMRDQSITPEEREEYGQLVAASQKAMKSTYQSSHWTGVPNVLAHVRMNDRVDADGARVLFVEELQSDWAQEGRKKGFVKGSLADADMVATVNTSDTRPYWEVKTTNGVFVANVLEFDPASSTPEQAIAAARKLAAKFGQRGVPRAPFVQSTDSWLNLALKRVITMAVEEGYDKIAFINGKQSAERYDLGQQLSEIVILKNEFMAKGFDDFSVGILRAYDLNGDEVFETRVNSIDDIESYIGKETAKKLLEAPTQDTIKYGLFKAKVLAGDDLFFGGEGMREFYDSIVPKAVAKLLPKIGGGKLEQVSVEIVTDEYRKQVNDAYSRGSREDIDRVKNTKPMSPQPGFTITPAMVDQVMDAGLPLFSRAQNIFGKPMPAASWQIQDSVMDSRVVYPLQDKFVDTKRVVEAINSAVGQIEDKWDPYLQEKLYHGVVAKQTKDFANDELKPLIEMMGRNRVTLEELDKYLHNRHAEERNIAIAQRNPALPDAGSGIPTADARQYLAALPAARRALLEGAARRVDNITKGTRQLLVSSGLEAQSTIDAWENLYKKYAPLMREELDYENARGAGTGRGVSVRGSSSRAAVGSADRRVVDIMANIAMQRERAIVRANKNKVSQALYGLALKNPSPDFWLPINPDAIKDPQALTTELINFGVDPKDAENIAKEPRESYVDPRTGLVSTRVNRTLRNLPNVVYTRVNGKDRFLILNNKNPRAERMAKALNNMDMDSLVAALSIAAVGTRWFASVNTQYNPIFGVINFARDVGAGTLNLSTTPLADKKARVIADTIPALRGIYGSLRGGSGQGQWAALWDEFQKVGGQTGFRDQFSQSEERARALQKELDNLSAGDLKKAGQATFNWLSDYNTAMENAVRLSAYKAALDKGLSKQRAAELAKDLTVNFNKKGAAATNMGALFAFFNASVQGTTRLAQTLRGPAGKKIISGGLLLGAIQALALMAAGFEEDEPPGFVKERNIVIPTGGGDYLTWPMPLGFNVIPNVGRIATEWALSGFENSSDRAIEMITSFFDMFNPIGNAGISMQTLSPTVFDPLVALSENRDWTGSPISREDMSGLSPTPGYLRARDSASVFTTEVARFFNLASGGTDFTPGKFSPTPEQLEYLAAQLTGGVGREVGKTVKTAEMLLSGEELPAYTIPLGGRLYGQTTGSAAESNRFYNNVRQMNLHNAELNGLRERRQSLQPYFRENPDARLIDSSRAAYRQVQALRNRKRDLLERKASREEIRRIEQQITNRMKQFNDRVSRIES